MLRRKMWRRRRGKNEVCGVVLNEYRLNLRVHFGSEESNTLGKTTPLSQYWKLVVIIGKS